MTILIILILIQQIYTKEFDWTELFDISIIITFIFIAICDIIAKSIQKKVVENTEDSAKLTEDYGYLNKKYRCNDLVKYENIVFPEECLWLRQGNEAILIDDQPEKFYNLPKQVADYSKELMEAHSASVTYNQINIRLDDIKISENQVVLKTSRTQYFDSLLTNRASDYIIDERNTTIREIYEPGPFMKPLRLSKMSNHLGFNGFVITCDKKTIPFILRKKNLSIAKNLWATSIGASMKTMYALDHTHGFEMTENSLADAVIGEIKDELHLMNDAALTEDNVKNSIFAFYRDFVESGKPQFLFCLELKDTTEEMLQKAISQNKEKNDMTSDGSEIRFFSLEDLKNAKFYINKIEINGEEYRMVPSSIVSVVLLLKYLD